MAPPLRPLLLAGLALSACGPRPPAEPTPEAGRAYFLALNCRSCHRVGGEGSAGGPDLTLVGLRHRPEWLERFLRDPGAWRKETVMPDPRLSGTARKALVAYLASLKGQDFGAAPPWRRPGAPEDPVEKGRLVYERAGCIACHGPGGAGGYPNNNVPGGLIPPLRAARETFTRAELVKKVRSGSVPQKEDPAGPEPLVSMPAWGEVLSDAELGAVADYLFSLEPGGTVPTDW